MTDHIGKISKDSRNGNGQSAANLLNYKKYGAGSTTDVVMGLLILRGLRYSLVPLERVH